MAGDGVLVGLPSPHDLDRARAADVARRIGAHVRPGLLARLRDAARAGDTEVLDRLDAELAELDAYDSLLDERLGLVSLHRAVPVWSELVTDHATYAAATSALFTCQLSRSFVHGPITLLHAVALCDEILGAGERVHAVRFATWARMATSGQRFEVRPARGPVAGLRDLAKREGRSLACRVATTAGRDLDVHVTPLPHVPVVSRALLNAWTVRLAGPVTRDATGTYRMALRPAPPEDVTPAVMAATLLDVLLAVEITAFRTQGHGFLASVHDLHVPERLPDGVECVVRPLWADQRPVRPDLRITPVDYAFPPLQRDVARCLVAGTDGHFAAFLTG